MAPKAKHPQGAKTKMVSVRLPDELDHQLTEAATRAGLTRSAYVLHLIENRSVKVEAASDVLPVTFINELKRLGNNLNQIAHNVHVKIAPEELALTKVLTEILRALAENEMTRRRMAHAIMTADDPGFSDPDRAAWLKLREDAASGGQDTSMFFDAARAIDADIDALMGRFDRFARATPARFELPGFPEPVLDDSTTVIEAEAVSDKVSPTTDDADADTRSEADVVDAVEEVRSPIEPAATSQVTPTNAVVPYEPTEPEISMPALVRASDHSLSPTDHLLRGNVVIVPPDVNCQLNYNPQDLPPHSLFCDLNNNTRRFWIVPELPTHGATEWRQPLGASINVKATPAGILLTDPRPLMTRISSEIRARLSRRRREIVSTWRCDSPGVLTYVHRLRGHHDYKAARAWPVLQGRLHLRAP